MRKLLPCRHCTWRRAYLTSGWTSEAGPPGYSPPECGLRSCVGSLTGELFPNHRGGTQQYSTGLSRLGHSPSEEQTNEITHPRATSGRLARSQPKSETCALEVVLMGPPLPCTHCPLGLYFPAEHSTISGGIAFTYPKPQSRPVVVLVLSPQIRTSQANTRTESNRQHAHGN